MKELKESAKAFVAIHATFGVFPRTLHFLRYPYSPYEKNDPNRKYTPVDTITVLTLCYLITAFLRATFPEIIFFDFENIVRPGWLFSLELVFRSVVVGALAASISCLFLIYKSRKPQTLLSKWVLVLFHVLRFCSVAGPIVGFTFFWMINAFANTGSFYGFHNFWTQVAFGAVYMLFTIWFCARYFISPLSRFIQPGNWKKMSRFVATGIFFLTFYINSNTAISDDLVRRFSVTTEVMKETPFFKGMQCLEQIHFCGTKTQR